MEPIDEPFRPKWDFYIAWALVGIGALFLTHQMEKDEGWFAYPAMVILLSLFSTFVLYGPVLLARQIIRSGSYGWLVARTFLAILIVAILIFGGLLLSGFYTESRAHALAFFFPAAAIAFLSWRTKQK